MLESSVVGALCEQCRNWGRWGEKSHRGTLNHITDELRREAFSLAWTGTVFPLALDMDRSGPQTGDQARFNPMTFMIRDGRDSTGGEVMGAPTGFGTADDVLFMPVHSSTHWDALCHVFWDGKMWDGLPAELVSSRGAEAHGVEALREGVVGRGVLLDVPRSRGLDAFPAGYAITVEDLERAASAQGSPIRPGDVLLVRTGDLHRARAAGDLTQLMWGDSAGLSLLTAPWLNEQRVAALGADNSSVEVKPREVDWPPGQSGGGPNPWHRVVIPNMGLVIGELFDLEALAAHCADTGRYEFLFMAAPLPITGATGSPVNPLAIT